MHKLAADPRRAQHPRRRPGTPRGPVLTLMAAWAAMLAWGVRAGEIPLWVLGAALSINVLTVLVYALDKSAARNGQQRTPESHLHLISLIGGWPGAWLAQQLLRHKSSKAAFLRRYWLMVALHFAGVTAWALGWLG